MASVISVPANEGISVFTNAPITTNNTQKNQDQLPKVCEDVESLKGRFGFKSIGRHQVPYIIRVINGEPLKFVSVRMAETQLLSTYLQCLHQDIYTCASVRSNFITEAEAKLLNVINQEHTKFAFGKELFFAGKDYIVYLRDVREFYTFLEVCYTKLLYNITPGGREKCGFIRIDNYEPVVPYCIKDYQKYVPLFYFEGLTENLKHRAIKLENWNLAYLKFCCKVNFLINNEFYASESCTVISLDDIKNNFPPETNFEEYWPANLVDTYTFTNQQSKHVNPPAGAWIKAPPEVVPAENTISHTLTAPSPLPPSMPVMTNTYQNGLPANQMGSTVSQGSSLVNSAGHVVPPPPLVRAGNTTPVIGNTISYSNSVPISQSTITMYNPMIIDNVMSHISQMRQSYFQCFDCNSQAQQQQLQQIISTHQTQQPYSDQSVHGRLTNTQHLNTRNARPVVIAPPLETSLVSPAVQEIPLRPNIARKLTRMPEQMWSYNTSNNAAYKSSTVSQGSSLVNSAGHVVPPPPLVHGAGNTTPVIGNTVSYSNSVPISQCTITTYNPMIIDNVMSHISQMRQSYFQCFDCNSQAQQQQLQPQQQIISTHQTQQPYSGQSVHGRLTNTQHLNTRNARPVVIAPPLETSLVSPAVQEIPLRPNIARKLTRMPEQMWSYDTSNNAAYNMNNM